MTTTEVFAALKLISSTISTLGNIYSVTRNAVPVSKNNLKSRRFRDMLRDDLHKLAKQATSKDGTRFGMAKSNLDTAVNTIQILGSGEENVLELLKSTTTSPVWYDIKKDLNWIRNSRTWNDVFIRVLSLKLSVFVQYIEAELCMRQENSGNAIALFLSECKHHFCEVLNRENQFQAEKMDFAKELFSKPAPKSADWQKLAAATRESFRAFVFFYAVLMKNNGQELTLDELGKKIQGLFPRAFELKSVSEFLTWIYDWQVDKNNNQSVQSVTAENKGQERLSDSIAGQSGVSGEQKQPKTQIEEVLSIPNPNEHMSETLVLSENMGQVVLVGKVIKDSETGTRFIFASTVEWVPNCPMLMGIKNIQFYGCAPKKMKSSKKTNEFSKVEHEAKFERSLAHDDINITACKVVADMEPTAEKRSLVKTFQELFMQGQETFEEEETAKIQKDVVRMWFYCRARCENCFAALDFDYSEGIMIPVKDEAVYAKQRLAKVFRLDGKLFGMQTVRDETPGKGRKPKVERNLRLLEWRQEGVEGLWLELGTIKSAKSSKSGGCSTLRGDGPGINLVAVLSTEKDDKFTTENKTIVVKLWMVDEPQQVQKVSIPSTSDCISLSGSDGKLVMVDRAGKVLVIEPIVTNQYPVLFTTKAVKQGSLIAPEDGVKSASVALIGLDKAYVVVNAQYTELVQLQGIP